MKKFLILLTFIVPIMGCVPGTGKQILDDTYWELDHAVIEGEVRELKDYETLHLHFNSDSVNIYDGCNYASYKSSIGRPVYAATGDGAFMFPFEDREEDEPGMVYSTTAMMCISTDEESGEEHFVSIPSFVLPFDKIVAYELSLDVLRLYYPEDKHNVLVFKTYVIPPTRTPAPIPELTLTAEIIIPATPIPRATLEPSTPYPALTPTPPTPYPDKSSVLPTPRLSYPYP